MSLHVFHRAVKCCTMHYSRFYRHSKDVGEACLSARVARMSHCVAVIETEKAVVGAVVKTIHRLVAHLALSPAFAPNVQTASAIARLRKSVQVAMASRELSIRASRSCAASARFKSHSL